ncbi:MAG TPA: beta-phosphoglucomutase [Chryseosolibacter sp.]
MIKGCIFDLDGVIVDTAHYHYLAWKRLANELGHDLTEKENEQLKGVSRTRSLEIILERAGISLNDEHKEILADKKNKWFNEYVLQMEPEEIFPGVISLIHDMRAHGIRVGLASSSRNARTVVRLLQIQNEFDAIVDGSMIVHTKPHPEIFLMTAEKLGVAPANCVVVEDAEAGVEAALRAGMKCIGIGSRETLGRADMVFPKTSDVRLSTIHELEKVGH